ncbi:hypothetical protein, partial [Plasmodium yoelii yoelii]
MCITHINFQGYPIYSFFLVHYVILFIIIFVNIALFFY